MPYCPHGPMELAVYRNPVDVRFSNRPFRVKHFQTIRRCSVDVALRALFPLRNRLEGPSIMGFEDEVEQSLQRPCRQTKRQVQADMRTHLIHRPARGHHPPLGGARVSFYWIYVAWSGPTQAPTAPAHSTWRAADRTRRLFRRRSLSAASVGTPRYCPVHQRRCRRPGQ